MSHFVTLVFVKKGLPTREAVESAVEDMLAPYDESIQVEEYERPCSCAKWKARSKARESATEKFPGGIDALRESFNKANTVNPEDPFGDSSFHERWQKYIKEYVDYEAEEEARFTKETVPDPECSDCHGTGVYKSTYNDKSKWDWWTIGGRWTGFLVPEYDPTKDPENIEECDLCGGTGTRTNIPIWDGDPFGVGKITGYKIGECNGCNGEGKRVSWTLRPYAGDIVPANKWLALFDQDSKKYSPFAFVTPDGEWYEKGKMGWWACVSDEKEVDNWQNEVKELIEKYANDYDVVVVDCHV